MTLIRIFTILLLTFSICMAKFTDTLDLQTALTFRIDSIKITGNKITKDEVILRELSIKPGDLINDRIIQYNKERIYSLGLFTFVRINPAVIKNSVQLIIQVDESWYIWPVPFIDIRDNLIRKMSYGMDIQYRNFRGMNETIGLRFALGYDPSLSLSYYRPWLIKAYDIAFFANFYYQRVLNKSAEAFYLYGSDFEHTILSGSLGIGKRFGLFHMLSVSTGFDYIETPKYLSPISASNERIDRIYKAGLGYVYDSRNLKQFPDSGIYSSASYIQKGFGINNVSYSVMNLDFRHYFSIAGDLSLKWRLAARFAVGHKVPLYDYSFLGAGEKVRGHFNDIREGIDSYVGSIEMKYPLINEWDLSLKLPLIPRELSSARIRIFTNLFYDGGAVRPKGKPVRAGDYYSGYGAGLLFLMLPYNLVRLEFAFDEQQKMEMILGFGFSF
ncbi:MAG: BamA/TamA family outer membrane protein [Methanococcaceae archaeon]